LSAIAVSAIVFALIFGGTLLGMLLRSRLPEHHLTAESKEVVRLATALVGTLAALVLGLLVASTRSSYEQTSGQISRMIVDSVVLDWLLAEYGPEATPLRQALRETMGAMADSIWRADRRSAGPFLANGASEAAYYQIQALVPHDAVQRALQARATQIATDLAQTRLLLFAQPADAISTPFLMVLVLWLALIFTSFTTFAPPNGTVAAVMFVCVLSASSAIFLILEMGSPFDGVMQISSEPLRNALGPMIVPSR
jgi:hypothetical protein